MPYVPPRRSRGCGPHRRPLGGGPGRRRRPCLWRAASRRTTRTSSTMCLSTSTGAGWPPAPAIRASRCAWDAQLPRARHRGAGGGAEGTSPDRGVRDPQPRTPPRRKRREPSPPADCGVTAARARGVFLPRLRGAALGLGALSARARRACEVGRGCGFTRACVDPGLPVGMSFSYGTVCLISVGLACVPLPRTHGFPEGIIVTHVF